MEALLLADGLTPVELYSMTPKEIDLRYYGILMKQVEAKRNLRDLAYMIHVHNVDKKDRLEIFDLMPIMGDPSKEKRIKDRIKEDRKIAAKQIRFAKKMGYIS